MIRLIKRYGSRKLYDTEESRYVSLEEIGVWVRQGQEIRVVDNQTSEDVTAQTLTQVILDEGRKGTSFPPSELLHELIRRGEGLVNSGVDSLQQGVDKLLQALSVGQRAVIELTYYFGYTYREISEILGCPENTVKTRMYHARRHLQDQTGGVGP